MDALSLPIVHPVFERLKRSGRWLHFAAALLILGHAFSHLRQPELGPAYFWCQLIIAADIFILVFAGRQVLVQLPGVNLFFRLVEILFFLGIAIMMLLTGKWMTSIAHFLFSLGYAFLLYCERKVRSGERLHLLHVGVSIPGIPGNIFLSWSQVNRIESSYDSIHIETSFNKNFDFDLRQNLSFGQLDQIHEFCRHYLGQ
jgi:hypothetical protein